MLITKNKIIITSLIILSILSIVFLVLSMNAGNTENLILLMIPIFALSYFSKNKISKKLEKIKTPLFLKFFIIGLLFGFLTEALVLIGGFGQMHNNLLIDFLLFGGLYGSIPVIWYFLLRKYEFSIKQVFILSGIFGVIIEQDFAILLSFNIFAYIYVFFAYASFMIIPYLFTQNEFNKFKRKKQKSKYVVAFFTQLLAYVFGFLWAATMQIILKIFLVNS